MSGYATTALALIGLALTAYLLFGGADFGAGLWHLLGRSAEQRRVIEHAMAPIWEANHVWLIVSIVLTWTAFPPVFATVMSEYWAPLSLAALGIVARGAGFAFRKALPRHRAYAVAFGLASVLTPFCLGSVAGAVATGESSWLTFPAVSMGVLTIGLCSYLAGVYLTWDAHRLAGRPMAEQFRINALRVGLVVGMGAMAVAVLLDAPWPLIAASVGAGLTSLGLLIRRQYLAVRVSAAITAATVLWGGGILTMSDLGVDRVAATDAVLQALLVALGVGGLIVVPSLAWLYTLFQKAPPGQEP